jgi:hypothetical protein
MDALRLALEIAPAEPALLRRMSDFASRRGNMAEALDWADRALAASPQDLASHNHLVTLHLSQANFAYAA